MSNEWENKNKEKCCEINFCVRYKQEFKKKNKNKFNC